MKSRALCSSLDGYLLEVYPQGLRNKLGLWAQNCQASEVKAQMPCQPAPGENIWGLGNGP